VIVQQRNLKKREKDYILVFDRWDLIWIIIRYWIEIEECKKKKEVEKYQYISKIDAKNKMRNVKIFNKERTAKDKIKKKSNDEGMGKNRENEKIKAKKYFKKI